MGRKRRGRRLRIGSGAQEQELDVIDVVFFGEETSTQPDHVHQRPAVGAGEGLRAHALPRRLRTRGPR